MGCYTKWSTYLEPDSEAYQSKLLALKAKFFSVKRIIDYYVLANEDRMPVARYSGWGTQYEWSASEVLKKTTIHAICHHMLCDGIDISDLLDIEGILLHSNERAASYGCVIVACHLAIRVHENGLENVFIEVKEDEGSWFV